AEGRFGGRLARDDPRAPQAVETVVVRARRAAKHAADNFEQIRTARQQHQDPAEVIAVDTVVAIGLALELLEADPAHAHLVQPAADQVRLTVDQANEAIDLRLVAQDFAVARIEIRDLLPA